MTGPSKSLIIISASDDSAPDLAANCRSTGHAKVPPAVRQSYKFSIIILAAVKIFFIYSALKYSFQRYVCFASAVPSSALDRCVRLWVKINQQDFKIMLAPEWRQSRSHSRLADATLVVYKTHYRSHIEPRRDTRPRYAQPRRSHPRLVYEPSSSAAPAC